MTTRKRIVAACLALCMFLSMSPISLAADEGSVTETQEVFAEAPVEQLPEETATDSVDLLSTTTTGNPALLFHYMNWDENGILSEETYDIMSWTGSPNSGNPVRFYFYDGTNYTRLSASDLTITDDLVRLEYDEDGEYYHMMGNALGTGSINYVAADETIYAIAVEVGLPDWGFYTQPEAKEEYYISDAFTVTEDCNQFYFVALGGGVVTEITLNENFEAIADAVISDDGSYVTFTVTGTPGGRWYHFKYSGLNRWGGTFSGWGDAICLNNGIPSAGIRYAGWVNGELVARSWSEFDAAPRDGIASSPVIIFYYGTADSYAPIENIVSVTAANPTILSISYLQDTVDGLPAYSLNVLKPGTTDLVVTTEDGSEYRVPFTFVLSSPWMFSTADFDEDTAITSFTITEDSDTFYFVCEDGNTMDGVTVEEEYADAFECEKVSDTAYSIRVIDPSKIPSGYYICFTTEYTYSKGSETCSVWFEIFNAMPRLVFRNTWWENDSYVENEYGHSSWTNDPGRAQGRFYFFDGENYTRVYASSLTVGNEKVAYLEDSGDLELSYIVASNFGETTVEYTHPDSGKTYSFPITVILPTWGFYAEPEAREDTYLGSWYTVTEDSNVIYFATSDENQLLTDVVLQGEFAEIATVEISEDGTYATITITGAPNGNYYSLRAIGVYTDGGSFSRYYGIELDNGMPGLFYRYMYWDNDQACESENTIASLNTTLTNNHPLRFYFFDGEDYNLLDLDDLTVDDSNVIDLVKYDGEEFLRIIPQGCGETTICYAVGDKVYTFPVVVTLPDFAYYATPYASENSILSGNFTVTAENNVLYFCAKDGCSITGFTFTGVDAGIATAELSDDNSYVKITVDPDTNFEGWHLLRYSGTNQSGYSFENRGYSIRIVNGMPKLVFHFIYNVEDDYNETNWCASPGSGHNVRFYYYDGETYTRLTADQLTVSDETVVALREDTTNGWTWINVVGFGQATISYTDENNRVTAVTIVGQLPEYGFYTTPYASEESYIMDAFTVNQDHEVFYYVAHGGGVMDSFQLQGDFAEIAEATLSSDGTYVTIQMTGIPDDRWYEVIHSGTTSWGYEYTEWYGDIYLVCGYALPGLVYHWVDWTSDGQVIEHEEDESVWYGSKGSGGIVRFYYFDGESYTKLSASDLAVSDNGVVSLETVDDRGILVSNDNFGTGFISYTAPDGTVYSVPVTVGLPEAGFYSTPYASQVSYITEFAVGSDCKVFYLVVQDEFTILDFTLMEDLVNIAKAEISDDGRYLTITVTGTPASQPYAVELTAQHVDGWNFTWGGNIWLREQNSYLTGKIYLPDNLDDTDFSIRLSDDLGGTTMISVNADTIQTDTNGKYVSYERFSPTDFYGYSTSVWVSLVDYQGTLLNSQTHFARVPYVSADGSLVYGGFYNAPELQIPADGALELNFSLPAWENETGNALLESKHGVTELEEATYTYTCSGAKGVWIHFDPRTDLDAVTINGKLYSLTKLFNKGLYVDTASTSGKLTIAVDACTASSPLFGFAITSVEGVYTTRTGGETHTLRMSDTLLPTSWNPLDWTDETVASYVTAPLVELTIKDSTTGEYQWVFVAAESITDVTATNQSDLVKYGCAESDATAGYVYEIKLRPEMCWEDGTPINADTYIYSMQQMLNLELGNSQASEYYMSEAALVGAESYYYSGSIVALDNSATGVIGGLNNLVKGDDGIYRTADGLNAYIALTSGLDWLGGYSLHFYVSRYGDNYFDATAYNTLYAMADENGFVVITDETWDLLTAVISNPNWGEGPGFEPNYIYYEVEFAEFSWDAVGLYKVDDYTIRYVCATAYDYYYFLEFCANNWIVHEGMFEYCLDAGLPYNGTAATTMSCGPYTVESVTDGVISLGRNASYWEYDVDDHGDVSSTTFFKVDGKYVSQYEADCISISLMSDEEAKQAYFAGELDVWTPNALTQSDTLLEYSSSDRLYRAQETFTMRLFFHTNLESLKKMDQAGNTNSVVLSSDKFREAMSLAINRAEFVTATHGYEAAYSMLSTLYYYDVYGDPCSVYRNTDEAKQAICNLYGVEYGPEAEYATLDEAYASITGFNLDKAKTLFAQACAELVAEGLYVAGEPIVIEMAWMAGAMDTANSRQIALLNKYMNEALEGTGFGSIELKGVDNMARRYEDVYNGVYAIGWGAWGGSAFYPYTMFRVYCDSSYVSYIHEGGCWDPASETLTLTINGVDVTMTWQAWSRSMIGIGKYANADDETKLAVLAGLEENLLKLYYCIPVCSTTSCHMLSAKVDWYTTQYNVMYGFGGVRLMSFNYGDGDWDESLEEGAPDYQPPMVAPAFKVLEDSAGRPKLMWDCVPGAKQYEIYRAESEDGEYTLLQTTESIDFVDESAEGGHTYFYKVRAVSDDKAGDFSSPAHVTCRHIASGETGDVRWQLTTDGTLLIHGSGKMGDYTESQPGPWMDWRASIKKIVIADGVTHVGAYAFHGGFGSNGGSATPQNVLQPIFSGVSTLSTTLLTVSDETTTVEVTVGSSVETVGSGAFAECTEVEEIVFTGDTAPVLEDETALPEAVVVYHTEEAAQSWAEVDVVEVETVVMIAPVANATISTDAFSAGESITLSVNVTGTPTPTLQWQYSSDGVTWTNVVGATSAEYVISKAGLGNHGNYRCVVTNGAGTVVTTAVNCVLVDPAVQIERNGASVSVTTYSGVDARSGLVCCAAYDASGRMIDIFFFNVSLADEGVITKNYTFSTESEIAEVHAFFVSADNFVPFCNAG